MSTCYHTHLILYIQKFSLNTVKELCWAEHIRPAFLVILLMPLHCICTPWESVSVLEAFPRMSHFRRYEMYVIRITLQVIFFQHVNCSVHIWKSCNKIRRAAAYSTAGHDDKKSLSPSSFHKHTNSHSFQAEGEISCSWIMLSLDGKDTKLRERRGRKPTQ